MNQQTTTAKGAFTVTVDVFDTVRTRGGRRLALSTVEENRKARTIFYTRTRRPDFFEGGRYDIDFVVSDSVAREVRVLDARRVWTAQEVA